MVSTNEIDCGLLFLCQPFMAQIFLNSTWSCWVFHSIFVKYSTEYGTQLFRMNFHFKVFNPVCTFELRAFLSDRSITIVVNAHNSNIFILKAHYYVAQYSFSTSMIFFLPFPMISKFMPTTVPSKVQYTYNPINLNRKYMLNSYCNAQRILEWGKTFLMIQKSLTLRLILFSNTRQV